MLFAFMFHKVWPFFRFCLSFLQHFEIHSLKLDRVLWSGLSSFVSFNWSPDDRKSRQISWNLSIFADLSNLSILLFTHSLKVASLLAYCFYINHVYHIFQSKAKFIVISFRVLLYTFRKSSLVQFRNGLAHLSWDAVLYVFLLLVPTEK